MKNNLPLFIALRYLFSKKRHHAINLISGIAVIGVAFTTMALICTLSVFNGFQDMVAGLFTNFDPELKITKVTGKVLHTSDSLFVDIEKMPEIAICTPTIEEQGMVQYSTRQAMVVFKGVEQEKFKKLTSIEQILIGRNQTSKTKDSFFTLQDEVVDYAIIGAELTTTLGCGIQFVDPLTMYLPKRTGRINLSNPRRSFTTAKLYSPGVVFLVNQQKYDAHYVLVPIQRMRSMLNYTDEASALEIKLKPDTDLSDVQSKIKKILGSDYRVQNRYEQQADLFKVMEVEKLISFIFLSFIFLIASLNIIGSLSMLIIDKQEDTQTLRFLGCNEDIISRIFLHVGRLICTIGAGIGLLIGLAVCWLQQHYGLIPLGNNPHFITQSYPVSIHWQDIVAILCIVIIGSWVAVWWPVKRMVKQNK